MTILKGEPFMMALRAVGNHCRLLGLAKPDLYFDDPSYSKIIEEVRLSWRLDKEAFALKLKAGYAPTLEGFAIKLRPA